MLCGALFEMGLAWLRELLDGVRGVEAPLPGASSRPVDASSEAEAATQGAPTVQLPPPPRPTRELACRLLEQLEPTERAPHDHADSVDATRVAATAGVAASASALGAAALADLPAAPRPGALVAYDDAIDDGDQGSAVAAAGAALAAAAGTESQKHVSPAALHGDGSAGQARGRAKSPVPAAGYCDRGDCVRLLLHVRVEVAPVPATDPASDTQFALRMSPDWRTWNAAFAACARAIPWCVDRVPRLVSAPPARAPSCSSTCAHTRMRVFAAQPALRSD